MSLLVWNVRGLPCLARRRDARRQLKKHFVGLVETRVRPGNLATVSKILPRRLGCVRELLILLPGKNMGYLESNHLGPSCSAQCITTECVNIGEGYNLSCVWIKLPNREATVMGGPEAEQLRNRVVIGDFNTVRFTNDKVGGRALPGSRQEEFHQCIDRVGLTDICAVGKTWSWNNHTVGSMRIAGRLDRALCNQQWVSLLPHAKVESLSPGTCDHAVLRINLSRPLDGGQKPFRHFLFLFSWPGYWDVVPEASGG